MRRRGAVRRDRRATCCCVELRKRVVADGGERLLVRAGGALESGVGDFGAVVVIRCVVCLALVGNGIRDLGVSVTVSVILPAATWSSCSE